MTQRSNVFVPRSGWNQHRQQTKSSTYLLKTQPLKEYLSRPDLREPFDFSIWLGQGVMWGGHSMFCFLCFFISMFWLGMVLNQGQVSTVVSDWESYLDSPFPLLSGWVVNFVRSIIAL